MIRIISISTNFIIIILITWIIFMLLFINKTYSNSIPKKYNLSYKKVISFYGWKDNKQFIGFIIFIIVFFLLIGIGTKYNFSGLYIILIFILGLLIAFYLLSNKKY